MDLDLRFVPVDVDGPPVVRRQLLADLSAVANGLLPSVTADIAMLDAYRRLTASAGAEALVESMRWVFDTFAACLAGARPLTHDELEHLRGIGDARARQGVPLAAVKESFRLVFRACCEELQRLGAAHPDGDAGSVVAGLLLELTELSHHAVDALGEGYAAHGPLAGVGRVQRLAAAVDRLLHADAKGTDAAVAELGWVRADRSCMAFALPVADRFTIQLRRAVDVLARALPGGVAGPVRTMPSACGVVLASLPSDDPTSFSDPCAAVAQERSLVIITVGPTTIDRLQACHQWLLRYAHMAGSLAGQGSTGLDALLPYLTLLAANDVAFARWRVQEVLGPVLELPPEQARLLLEAMEGFHETGATVGRVAQRLSLSEPGLRKRLGRIKRLTGLDPARPGDSHVLLQTLGLLRLHAASLPSTGDTRWVAAS